MRAAKRGLLLTIFLLLQACSAAGTPDALPSPPLSASSPLEGIVSPTPLPPFLEQVRKAEYPLGAVDAPRTVRLVNGRYAEGSSGANTLIVTMTDFLALGDLDADGEDEAAVLVAEQYGGAHTYYFLAVYRQEAGRAAYIASIFLDDRPLIHALSIQQDEIYLEASVHTADDPTCCPSERGIHRYGLNAPNLVLTYYATQTPGGQPRSVTIEAPLDGAQVSGRLRLKGNVSVAPFENTLIYRLFDMGGVELSAGPLEVTAAEPGAPGVFETAIDLGHILANTTIRIVVQDLSPADGSLLALDSVTVAVK